MGVKWQCVASVALAAIAVCAGVPWWLCAAVSAFGAAGAFFFAAGRFLLLLYAENATRMDGDMEQPNGWPPWAIACAVMATGGALAALVQFATAIKSA